MTEDKSDPLHLKKAGLKVTAPRTKILALLENTQNRHLSAEEIYKQLSHMGEDIGLATIYRVLTQFEAADIVIRHYFESGHATFELNEGPHHDHLMCVQCGRVEEFVDKVIEARQKEVALRFGYQITDHCLHLFGICKPCLDKKGSGG